MRIKGIRNCVDWTYCKIAEKSPLLILVCKGLFDPIANILEYKETAKFEFVVSKELFALNRLKSLGQLLVVSDVNEEACMINKIDIIILCNILL